MKSPSIRNRTNRTIACLTGAAVIGVVVVVSLIHWKDLVAQYHLYKIRENPEYFIESLEEPEGTTQRKAIRAFLRSREGKDALFREYAEIAVKSVFAEVQTGGYVQDVSSTVVEGLMWAGEQRASYIQWGPPKDFAKFGISLNILSTRRWKAVRQLLEALDGSEFTLPEYSELRFAILHGAYALERSPHFRRQTQILPAEDELTCVVRREARVVVPAMIPLLAHSNFTVRQDAAYALGNFGAKAESAVSSLETLLSQRRFQREPDGSIDYRVQKAAEDAMNRIKGKVVLEE